MEFIFRRFIIGFHKKGPGQAKKNIPTHQIILKLIVVVKGMGEEVFCSRLG